MTSERRNLLGLGTSPFLDGTHHTNEVDGGLLYYRNALNWQVLRPGAENAVLLIDANGLPEWVAVGDFFGSPTGAIDIGDAQADGTATTAARSDHEHAVPAPATGYPVDVAATEADGSATTPARSDHVHAHGSGYLPNAHHNESHTVASHSDTTATGAELETLTDGSNADSLHAHTIPTVTTLLSGTFPIDATGLNTLTTAHGLGTTPVLKDIQLTVVINAGDEDDDWAFDLLKVQSVDATNVVAKINVSTASASTGADARLAILVVS